MSCTLVLSHQMLGIKHISIKSLAMQSNTVLDFLATLRASRRPCNPLGCFLSDKQV